MWRSFLFAVLVFHHNSGVDSLNCDELLNNYVTEHMVWSNLEQCLLTLGGKRTPRNVSENIWRLVKIAFDGLENISPEIYGKLGGVLTAIPMEDLRNISMARVETVEAFGAIRLKSKIITEKNENTFSEQQMRLIARKVRSEWLGKSPKTYSEFDLLSMGQIICHLNVTDILQIHPDAFRFAAEWIGELQNCPQDRLEAFAELAANDDAFGKPKHWSKIVVSIIGNILNGLSPADIETIDKDKLHLNIYQAKQSRSSLNDRKPTDMAEDVPTSDQSTKNSMNESIEHIEGHPNI